MGLYDRSYYQEESPRSPFSASSRTMVVNIILVNVAIYVVDGFFLRDTRFSPSLWLATYTDTVLKPWMWWQFLTAGFCHNPKDIGHIIFNMVGLFFLGQAVEQHYGPRKFLRLYLTSIVIGTVIWCLTNMLTTPEVDWGLQRVIGASGAVTTVVMLFALNFPRRTILFMMFIPMPAWVMGVMLVVFNLFGTQSGNESRIAYDIHLVGAAYAYLYFRTGWAFGLPGNPFSWLRSKRKEMGRPKLKVFDAEERYEVLDRQADEILEKLHRDGQDALTPKERRILEDYSRRMKQKHR